MGDLYKQGNGGLVLSSAKDSISISVGGKPNTAGKTLFRFELPAVTMVNGVYKYPTNQPGKYAILPNLKSSTAIFSYGASVDDELQWTNSGDAESRIIKITFHIPVLENTRKGNVANAEQTISTQFSIRNFSTF